MQPYSFLALCHNLLQVNELAGGLTAYETQVQQKDKLQSREDEQKSGRLNSLKIMIITFDVPWTAYIENSGLLSYIH